MNEEWTTSSHRQGRPHNNTRGGHNSRGRSGRGRGDTSRSHPPPNPTRFNIQPVEKRWGTAPAVSAAAVPAIKSHNVFEELNDNAADEITISNQKINEIEIKSLPPVARIESVPEETKSEMPNENTKLAYNLLFNELNTSWTLYYHSADNNTWTIDSYKKIIKFNTVEEFFAVHRIITNKHLLNGMFFLMKDDIPPYWECPENEHGGSWSLCYKHSDVWNNWINWCCMMIGCTVTTPTYPNNNIVGITISPKKNFSVIKIWNRNSKEFNYEFINFPTDIARKDVFYRPHNN